MSKIEKKLYKYIHDKYKLREIVSKVYGDYILGKMDDIPVLRKEKEFQDAVRNFVGLELARFLDDEEEEDLEDFYREIIGKDYDDQY